MFLWILLCVNLKKCNDSCSYEHYYVWIWKSVTIHVPMNITTSLGLFLLHKAKFNKNVNKSFILSSGHGLFDYCTTIQMVQCRTNIHSTSTSIRNVQPFIRKAAKLLWISTLLVDITYRPVSCMRTSPRNGREGQVLFVCLFISLLNV